MIRLNRTTEYGLLALQHMSRKQAQDQQGATSAREIADLFGLPFEITARTLQRLKDTGIIYSAQGAKGGYTLKRPLSDITLNEFLELMEGPQKVVACSTLPSVGVGDSAQALGSVGAPGMASCEYSSRCGISGPMASLNTKVQGFLSGIRLADLTGVQSS